MNFFMPVTVSCGVLKTLSRIDDSFATMLLSPTTSTGSILQPRTQAAYLTSLFSLFLYDAVMLPLQAATASKMADATTLKFLQSPSLTLKDLSLHSR